MPETIETSYPSSRQFSIRTLVILMCVVSGVAALFSQAGADMACGVLLICGWCALLCLFGGVRRFLLTGLLLGLFISVVKFRYVGTFPCSAKMVLVPFGLPLLVLNGFALAGDRKFGKWASVSNVDIGCRKAAAWKSLFAPSLAPLSYAIPGVTDTSELALSLVCVLVFFATAPWAVFWRRRRLVGCVFKKNWIDKLSWGISSFAFAIAVISTIPISLVFIDVSVREIFEPSRQGVGFFWVSIIGFYLVNSLASVLVIISWTIQWFRDRWWHRLNWLVIGWSTLVFATYLAWLKYFV